MTTVSPTPTLSHRAIPWPERPTVLSDQWRRLDLWELLDIAAGSGTRTLLLIAGPYAAERPLREWWLAPADHGWQIANYTSDPPQARYHRDRTTIDVRTTGPWFGHDLDPARVRAAWQTLSRVLRGTFDRGVSLMGTPARTGLDLVQRSLPRHGMYPILPDDLRTIMHANAPQGRLAFLPTERTHSDLYWLDGRWMYAACVSNLPCGLRWLFERSHAYIERVPAMYFAGWRAPADWPFPFGLLPELTDDEEQRCTYPTDHAWHSGWMTGAEYELARAEGWEIRISQRMTWDMAQPDPLRNWATKLRTIREHTPDPLVAYATRHLLIDTVGAFARQARAELHLTPRADAAAIPVDAYGEVIIGEHIQWSRDVPLARETHMFAHPEWSWTVWGRARTRAHRAALEYLRSGCGEIAVIFSDALVVTADPGWEDDGRVGRFRVKRTMRDVAVPRTRTDYNALIEEED